MKELKFYAVKDTYGFFSNFWTHKTPLIIDGEKWLNTEAYFQAMKFRGPHASKQDIEYSNIIKLADGPAKIASLGRQKKHRFGGNWKINKKEDHRLMNDIIEKYKEKATIRPDWEKEKIRIMIKAVVHKFMQYTELRKELQKIPDDTLIIEHTRRDRVWGDGGDGSGKNYLGKILTSLVYIIKYGNCEKMSKKLKKTITIRDNKFLMNKVPELNTGKSYLSIGKFPKANKYKTYILNMKIPKHPCLTIFGKRCHPRRYTQFYSDESSGYKYSGGIASPLPLTKELKSILTWVNNKFNDKFNGILINKYEGGTNTIGAHSDDESSLGKSGVVGIVFDTSDTGRKMRFRSKNTRKIIKDIEISDSTIYHMGGDFQNEFTHEIPEEKRKTGTRVSLTFRKHT